MNDKETERKIKYGRIIWRSLVIIAVIAASFSFYLERKADEAFLLSPLSMENVLGEMSEKTELSYDNAHSEGSSFPLDNQLLELFRQESWRRRKQASPLESIPDLRIYMEPDFHLSFYLDENLLMIYNEKAEGKYSFYLLRENFYRWLTFYFEI